MAASRSTAKPAEVSETDAEPIDGAAAAADPALAAPDSPIDETSEVAPAEPVYSAPSAPVQPVSPAQQVVYVEAPRPFVKKGNRGFGVLIAIASTVIFAALYAVSELLTDVYNKLPASFDFVSQLDFWVPAIVFAVGFIVIVLILNRAGWAAHVLGSLLIGLFVYFVASAAFLLIHAGTIPSNQVASTYGRLLFSPGAIIAGLLAREVSLWMGFAIAARGRRVKVRNVDARALYDQEIATKRAEYERANAAARIPAAPAAAAPVVEEPVAPVVDEAPVTEPTVAPENETVAP